MGAAPRHSPCVQPFILMQCACKSFPLPNSRAETVSQSSFDTTLLKYSYISYYYSLSISDMSTATRSWSLVVCSPCTGFSCEYPIPLLSSYIPSNYIYFLLGIHFSQPLHHWSSPPTDASLQGFSHSTPCCVMRRGHSVKHPLLYNGNAIHGFMRAKF